MVHSRLDTLYGKIAQLAAEPDDYQEARLQKTLLLGACFVFIPVVVPWILVHVAYDEPLAAAISSLYLVLSAVAVIAYLHTRRFDWLLLSQQVLVLFLPFFFQLAMGGFDNASAVVLWSVICPLGTIILSEPQRAVRWMIGYGSLLAVGAILEPYLRASNNLPQTMINLFFVLNLGAVSTIVFILLYYFVREKNRAYGLLDLEREKSERLLLNVLPAEIAPILKEGQPTIADQFKAATILFADVVGFTPLSTMLSPSEMVELLNEIFSHFDSLVEKYNLEKIRTIGDNYMVAAGVPRPREDHLPAIADLALDILDYVNHRISIQERALTFRIGINTGPVIAGVIGRRKFHYDLWGDTVNTASRMESHGLPGKIQITRAVYEALQDRYICEPRGTIVVKGKGEMETWFLTGRRT